MYRRIFILALVILLFHPAVGLCLENEDCLACHGDPSFERHIDPVKFQDSVHSALHCTSCHTNVTEIPHPEKLAPVQCSQCHSVESQIYLQSDHGKAVASGMSEAASCQSCHGSPHAILNSRNPNSPVSRAHIPETCAKCHDNSEVMSKIRLAQPLPYRTYLKSVHGKAHEAGHESAAVCTDCHGSHDLHGSINPASKIYKLNIPKTCGRCHENVLKTYERSIHGKAIRDGLIEAPVCTDCHGEHRIQGPGEEGSPVAPAGIVKTCAHCHASEKIITKYGLPTDRLETYMESYHGLAHQAGSLVVANCASCHGFHDILPSSDSLSSIHSTNLARTCGKCHPGAGSHLARAKVHSEPLGGGAEKLFLRWVRLFYLWLIGILVSAMVFHNLLDFLKKMISGKSTLHDTDEERMNFNERIQHFILTLTFVGLAYTGMCHRYPRAKWAMPLMRMEHGADIRRFLHRAFAIAFILLAAYHLFWLVLSRRGKSELKALRPARQDLKEAKGLVSYNIGLQKEPPAFGRFNYIEKMEYWALIWGAVIMTATGFLLTFENFTLRFFPKWVTDLALTIHFYEALLAILAVLVWHFYWTIYDPDVYPMSWAWLTGFKRRRKEE